MKCENSQILESGHFIVAHGHMQTLEKKVFQEFASTDCSLAISEKKIAKLDYF